MRIKCGVGVQNVPPWHAVYLELKTKPNNSGGAFYLPLTCLEMQMEKPASEGNLNIHLSTCELSVVDREGPSKSLFARLPFVSHCFWVALQASVYQMFALPQLPVNCLPLLSAKWHICLLSLELSCLCEFPCTPIKIRFSPVNRLYVIWIIWQARRTERVRGKFLLFLQRWSVESASHST